MGNALSKQFVVAVSLLAVPACGDDLKRATNDAAQPGLDAPTGTDASAVDASPDAPDDAPAGEANLILHYAFEDSSTVVTDSSVHHANGTLTDVAGWTADGREGRALAMTGAVPADTYVSLPSGVLTGVDDFTISFWVKLNSVAPWARIYDLGNGQADAANRFMYFTPNGFSGAANGAMAASFGGSPSNENVTLSPTLLPTGAWKHIAVVGAGGDRTIYIDGFPAATVVDGPRVPPSEMEPLSPSSWIGKSRFSADPGLDGTVDEFKIYDRALTQAEVADRAWPKLDYSYWRFDEGDGTVARDSSDHAIPTALGTGVTWTTGRLGGGLELPGGPAGASGPMVTLAANPLAACTTELTIAAWVRSDTMQPWSRVFDFGTGTTSFIYLAPSDGAGMHFAMVSPNGLFDLVSPTVPFAGDGSWHHVAVTVAADHSVKLYADGAVIASGASPDVTPADFASATDLWLGKSRFPDAYFDGAIDELRIGCRALTADEIVTLSRP
ncbi:MAG TPA: LamG domain-containing protein [Kofleriaceae bacterium]|jgi:hypothetical protein|nr:LamG domain-containing protein [Kofleriaceae bacterium]